MSGYFFFLSIFIKACILAIENHLNRRNSTDLRDVKGVNYDIEKIKKGLTSGAIDVPKHQSIEETAI